MHFPTLVRRLVLPLAVAAALAALPGPAMAAPAPTTLTLTAPASGKAGVLATFTATLTNQAGATPVAGATVTLQRTGGAPATGITADDGTVSFNASLPAGTTTWRASYAGDASFAPATSETRSVVGLRFASTVQLTGPRRLVDEHSATLSILWKASDGSPVSGIVTVQRRLGAGRWTVARKVRTSSAGRAAFLVAPRVDSQWRAVGAAGTWWLASASSILPIDNVPQVAPASYPKAAPRPVGTRAQSRATGVGANPVITTIPTAVWRSMTGRTWHAGCPVGRSGLRLLRINYWGFDGYRYRGEMVLSSAIARRAAAALRDMYDGRFPIRRMYRVDRFGWSKRVHGANDYASMRADNTSAFNCRSVVNKPSVLSPHARGRAVDVNTWENPYRSATGLVPNTWWASHSNPRYAWRSSSHPVVKIWRSHGFRWTYGNVDSQHLDGRHQPLSGSFLG